MKSEASLNKLESVEIEGKASVSCLDPTEGSLDGLGETSGIVGLGAQLESRGGL